MTARLERWFLGALLSLFACLELFLTFAACTRSWHHISQDNPPGAIAWLVVWLIFTPMIAMAALMIQQLREDDRMQR